MSTIVQNEPTDAPAGPPAPVRPHSMRVIPTIVALAGVLVDIIADRRRKKSAR